MREFQNNSSHSDGMMKGLIVGTLLGAGIALLMAPAAGTETRRRLSDAARRVGGDAKNRLDDVAHRVKDKVGSLRHDVKDAVDAGRDALASEFNSDYNDRA